MPRILGISRNSGLAKDSEVGRFRWVGLGRLGQVGRVRRVRSRSGGQGLVGRGGYLGWSPQLLFPSFSSKWPNSEGVAQTNGHPETLTNTPSYRGFCYSTA